MKEHSRVSDPEPDPTTATQPRVFIASEVRLYREGLASLLSQNRVVSVVGSAPMSDALRLTIDLRPDVVLVDASLPDGLALASRIFEVERGTRIVGFALGEVDRDVIACAEAGMTAYVTRDCSVEDLLGVVEQ